MTLRHSLALQMAFLLAGNFPSRHPDVLGIVIEAYRAHVNTNAVSEGATVYDGDRFSTEQGGVMRLRGEGLVLDLREESGATVHSRESGSPGTNVELSRGTLLFNAERIATLEINAREARIRPEKDERTVAQVSIAGPRELCIYARRGALRFSYRGETETIAERAAYRVILNPADELQKKEPIKPARRRKAFLFIAIGGAAAGVGIMVYEDHENHRHKHESPDRP